MIAARMADPAHLSPPDSGFAGSDLACRRGERLIFRGLDFALPEGGALVLTGPNGSGKSSLLRLMAALTPPETGILAWDGVDIAADRAAHRRRLHFIGHADGLKPVLSSAEMLRFWAGMRGGAAMPDEALAQFGLTRQAELPCRYLSAGQKRRLALARLVASPADLWLLDEPATGLDADSIERLFAAMSSHRAQGGRIVVSTHAPLPLPGAQFLSLASFRPKVAELVA